jgi:hypothetical protein
MKMEGQRFGFPSEKHKWKGNTEMKFCGTKTGFILRKPKWNDAFWWNMHESGICISD